MAPKAKKCLLVFFSSPTWHTEHVSSGALFRVRVSRSQKLDTHDKRQARAWARAALAKLERPRAWPQGTATPPRAQHILCQLHVCKTLGPHRSIKTQCLFSCFTLFLSTRSLLDRTKAKTIVCWPCLQPFVLALPGHAAPKIVGSMLRRIPLCRGSSCSFVNSSVGGSGVLESAQF